MPDHFPLLLNPGPAETNPSILKGWKEQTADRVIKTPHENSQHRWCRKMLARPRLPPTVHDQLHYHLGPRRFNSFNVYSKKKRQEKLNSMHNHPVKRGLVSSLEDWPGSSWRFYFLQDASILRMDRLE